MNSLVDLNYIKVTIFSLDVDVDTNKISRKKIRFFMNTIFQVNDRGILVGSFFMVNRCVSII